MIADSSLIEFTNSFVLLRMGLKWESNGAEELDFVATDAPTDEHSVVKVTFPDAFINGVTFVSIEETLGTLHSSS